MSLRANLAANYVSQLYMAAMALAMVPVYIASLGSERYGLVALLGVFGGIVQLFDAGMSMTLTREAAQLRAGACDRSSFLRVQRLINRIFIGVALVVGVLGFAASGFIARHWLRLGALDESLAHQAIVAMLLIVLINGVCNPYRGVLRGLEQQGRLAAISGGATTLRCLLDLAVLCLLHWGVLALLGGQLVVAVLEASVLWVVSRQALSSVAPALLPAPGAVPAARRVLRFALGLGFTTTVWIVATQADKLLLSRWLPLSDYGVFVMATLAASGVTLLNGPIGVALMPRLTVLFAQNDEQQRRDIYRRSSRFVCALVGSAALVMAALAEPLVFAWTGNRALAAQVAPLLAWYALGNGLLAIVALPYYLQYSAGDLRLHVRGNIVFILVLVPALWLAVRHAGAMGAAWVWFGQNLFYFLIWSFVVHARFAPGLQMSWMCSDVLGTLLWPALVVSLVRMVPWVGSLGRLSTLAFIGLVSAICLLGAMATAWRLRRIPGFHQRVST